MIRIVCPSCHSPLSLAELERVTIEGEPALVCPECFMVLVVESSEETNITGVEVDVVDVCHNLEEHFSEPASAHA